MAALTDRIWEFMQAPPPEERIFRLHDMEHLAASDQELRRAWKACAASTGRGRPHRASGSH